MWLGSCAAVVVAWAGGHSSDSTPSLESFICHDVALKKTKKKFVINFKKFTHGSLLKK